MRIGWRQVLVVVGRLRLFWRGVERHPAMADEVDLDPRRHIVAGEVDRRGAARGLCALVGDLAVAVFGQEPEHHAAAQAQFARHQGHRRSVLFAVADHRRAREQAREAEIAVPGQRRVVRGDTKYNDKGELIAEYDTNRANNSFYLNWVYSNLHIVGVNKVQGLTYQEYKDWCKEIGVKVDD